MKNNKTGSCFKKVALQAVIKFYHSFNIFKNNQLIRNYHLILNIRDKNMDLPNLVEKDKL